VATAVLIPFLSGGLLALTTGPVLAGPSPSPSTTFAIPLSQLGLGTTVTLAGITATQTLTIPVPSGLTPSALIGTASLSLGSPQAVVSFTSDGQQLSVLHLDNDVSERATNFSIPLNLASIHNGAIGITVTSFVPFPDSYCRGQYVIPLTTLDNLVLAYSGSAALPRTVADFFPPILTLLRVWLPPDPTAAQTQAATDLATAVVALDPDKELTVDVGRLAAVGLPNPGPFTVDVRDVIIGAPPTGGGAVALRFGDDGEPFLVFSGDGSDLENATATVSSALAALIQTASATIAGPFVPAVIPAAEQTVGQLGAGTLDVSGEGRLDLNIPFSQAAFGGMVDGLTLHLRGEHTPVPAGSAASLAVLVNGVVVASRTLGPSGRFDLQPRVPGAELQRDNLLTIEVAYTPVQGVCAAGAAPFDLRLDPKSTVAAHLGPSLPLGFTRLPQALLPGFDLALDRSDPVQVAAAIELTCRVAELSGQPLEARVVSPASVAQSLRPAIVFAPADALPVGLRPTVDLGAPSGTVDVDQPAATVSVGTLAAAAQVFVDHARTITLVSWRSDQDLRSFASLLLLRAPTLSDLSSDVVVLTQTMMLRQVAVAATLSPAVPAGTTATPLPWWAWPTVAILPVGLIALTIRWRVRRRRT